jgi:hypothetical protein
VSLIQLIYCSKASPRLTKDDIEFIWLNAIINNTKHSIQGLLIFYNNYFIQLLEGDEDEVEKLYSNISKDNRHNDVILIGQQNVKKTQFRRWAMGYNLDNELSIEIIKKYFPSGFTPEHSSFLILKNLLVDVSEVKGGIASKL